MPNYLVGIYEERFGTIVVQAENEILAAEKTEEAINGVDDITKIETYTEHSFDKGVAVEVNDDELSLAVSEIINDS